MQFNSYFVLLLCLCYEELLEYILFRGFIDGGRNRIYWKGSLLVRRGSLRFYKAQEGFCFARWLVKLVMAMGNSLSYKIFNHNF